MKSRAHPSLRPVACGTVALLLAAFTVAQAAPPAQAEESPLAGVTLPVPATDVSESDTDLAGTDREVVVLTAGSEGPEVTKLRARSVTDAKTLAAQLDAMPGVTASLNHSFSLPEEPVAGEGKSASTLSWRADIGNAAMLAAVADEEYGSRQWGLSWVGADAAWQVTRGRGVTVAIVDSGVETSHPELIHQSLPQIDIPSDGLTGDVAYHGTYVAGVIAAAQDGVGVVGLAPEATILPIRVLDREGSCDDYTLALGITTAVEQGRTSSTCLWAVPARTRSLPKRWPRPSPRVSPSSLPEVTSTRTATPWSTQPHLPACSASPASTRRGSRPGSPTPGITSTWQHLARTS